MDFGLSCRSYVVDGQRQGVPDREWIGQAVRQARKQMMTERRIRELASEVVEEVRLKLSGFAIERTERIANEMKITFRWNAPFLLEVSINIYEHMDDEAVKADIRSQLKEFIRPRAAEQPPAHSD